MNARGPALVCSVLGWSNSGKTTLIESAIVALRARGLACAALKATRHPGSFNVPGKDSSRFLAAGGEAALLGGEELVLSLQRREAPDPALIARLFPEARIVFVEGARIEGATAVLVCGDGTGLDSIKFDLSTVDAIVSALPELAEAARARGLRAFAPTDIDSFLAFLEARMENQGSRDAQSKREATIFSNGKEVPLAPFVAELVASTALGIVASLKGVDPDAEIVIRVKAAK